MTESTAPPLLEDQPESLLTYLPSSAVREYRNGQTIYHQGQRLTCIYLVIEGTVKISRLAPDGKQIVIDVYGPDEFVGESALLNLPSCAEQMTAVENSKLMIWTISALEELVVRRPHMGLALLQMLVQRTMDLGKRLEGFWADNSASRLARALIRFSERLGTPQEDGSVHMMPLPHELLGHYVGTSREIVTCNMNQFRREGYVQYSRKCTILRPDSLREALRLNA